MTKSIAAMIAFTVISAITSPVIGADLPPPIVNVSTWPQMSVSAFGCYLEKTFGYRDKRFNCSLKGYKNQGDPCKNTDAYYEGPTFPRNLATKVYPLATDIELSWEHGELQEVRIMLAGTLNEVEVRNAFKLPRAAATALSPAERETLPENIEDTDIQYPSDPIHRSPATRPSDPSRGQTVVVLEGFDHIGAGDVDCGDDG